MKKHLFSIVGSLLGLLVLGGLTVTIVLSFGLQQPTRQTSYPPPRTPTPPKPPTPASTPRGLLSLACSPALRPADQRTPAIVQPPLPPNIPSSALPMAATPTQSAQGERGSRVGPPTLLIVSNQQAAIGLQVVVHGNQLAIPVTDAEGWTCLFVSDLATGRSEQIATLRGALADLVLSDRYLVWTDHLYIPGSTPHPPEPPPPAPGTPTRPPSTPRSYTPTQDRTEMHVYDLGVRREVDFLVGSRQCLSLDGDVLVWQTYGGIYGQHLTTGQLFTVTTQEASCPKVAGEWVAYAARANGQPELLVADLHLFNWRTGEDRLLGLVSHQVYGGGYALDGESLVWIKVHFGTGTLPPPLYELHVVTLATGQDRMLNISDNDYLADLRLSDGLLLYFAQKGWQAMDLRRDRQFAIFPSSMAGINLSGNRLIWVVPGYSPGTAQLYTALVDRE